jgi:heptosyltransferase-2
MHAAVILPNWVGDVVMATPVLRGVRAHVGAGGRVTAVLRAGYEDLLAGTSWVDDVIPYCRRQGRLDPAVGFRAVAGQLRAAAPDVALILPNSLSSAALAWAGGVRRRIGLRGHWRRALLTDVVPLDDAVRLPTPARFAALLAPLGAHAASLQVELGTTPAEQRAADELLELLFPGCNGPLVMLNDNSANGAARGWGTDRFAALASLLVARLPDCRVLVHCGPDDRDSARAVVAAVGLPSVRGMGDVAALPLGLSKAVYRRAALAITTDSGPRHIAAAFGVPTVALVGPTKPLDGRSDPARCHEIRRDLPCSPCDQPICPLVHQDCMRRIDVEEVCAAALDLHARFGRTATPTDQATDPIACAGERRT